MNDILNDSIIARSGENEFRVTDHEVRNGDIYFMLQNEDKSQTVCVTTSKSEAPDWCNDISEGDLVGLRIGPPWYSRNEGSE